MWMIANPVRVLKYEGPAAFRGFRDEEYGALLWICLVKSWTDFIEMRKAGLLTNNT